MRFKKAGVYHPSLRRCKMVKSLKAILASFPSTCIEKVRLIKHAEFKDMNDLDEAVNEIAWAEGVDNVNVRRLLDAFWASVAGVEIVTIFVNDKEWLSGKTECFDWRYGTQIIPRGSWAIGFFVRGNAASLAAPELTESRKQALHNVLQDALEHVGAFNTDVEELIERQVLPIEEF